LIARIAQRAAAVTVILDCCSAAGATRDALDPQDRFVETPQEYVLGPDEGGPGKLVRGVTGSASREPRCLLVAACRDDQRARESLGQGGLAHGELTRALVRRLAALERDELASVRWGRVWRAVEAEVRLANPMQSPWLSGGFGRFLFGFGPDQEGDPGYAV